jgi:hypothetical protein
MSNYIVDCNPILRYINNMFFSTVFLFLMGVLISSILARVVGIPLSRTKIGKASELKLYKIFSVVIGVFIWIFSSDLILRTDGKIGPTSIGDAISYVIFYSSVALGFVLVGRRYFK